MNELQKVLEKVFKSKLGSATRAEIQTILPSISTRDIENVLDIMVSSASNHAIQKLFCEVLTCSLNASVLQTSVAHLLTLTSARDIGIRQNSWALISLFFQQFQNQLHKDEKKRKNQQKSSSSSSTAAANEQTIESKLKNLSIEAVENALATGIRDRSVSVRENSLHVLRICAKLTPNASSDVHQCLEDPSHSVRLNALLVIRELPHSELTSSILDSIIERTRDISCDVRESSYALLCSLPISALSRSQIRKIVRNGISDPLAEAKRAFIESVCRNWTKFKTDKENEIEATRMCSNVCSVIVKECMVSESDNRLDVVDVSSEELGLNLVSLVAKRNGIHLKDISESFKKYASSESIIETRRIAFTWRGIANDIINNSRNDEEEDLISATEFCEMLSKIQDDPFTLRQLLLIGCYGAIDFSDEAGRRSLLNFIRSTINSKRKTTTNYSFDVISSASELLCKASGGIEQMCKETSLIISDLQKGISFQNDEDIDHDLKEELLQELKRAYKIAEEHVIETKTETQIPPPLSLLCVCDDIQSEISLVKIGKFSKLSQQRTEIRRLTLVMAILRGISSSPSSNSLLKGPLSWIIREIVLPAIGSESPTLRRFGIESFGIACMTDSNLAAEHFLLFSQVILHDLPSIKVIAIKALFDFLVLFDLSKSTFLQSNNQTTLILPTAIKLLESCLDSEEYEIRITSFSGFIKLIYTGQFQIDQLKNWIARLLAESFIGDSFETLQLREAVFSLLSEISKRSKDEWNLVANSLLPAALIPLRASSRITSTANHLCEMFSFVKSILLSNQQNHGDDNEDHFASFLRHLTIDLLRECWENSKGSEGRMLPNMLELIDLPQKVDDKTPENICSHLEHTEQLVRKLIDQVSDRNAKKKLEIFIDRLTICLGKEIKTPVVTATTKTKEKEETPSRVRSSSPTNANKRSRTPSPNSTTTTGERKKRQRSKSVSGKSSDCDNDKFDDEKYRELLEKQKREFEELDAFEVEGLTKHKPKPKVQKQEQTQVIPPFVPSAQQTQSNTSPKHVRFEICESEQQGEAQNKINISPPEKKKKKEMNSDWLKKQLNSLYSPTVQKQKQQTTTTINSTTILQSALTKIILGTKPQQPKPPQQDLSTHNTTKSTEIEEITSQQQQQNIIIFTGFVGHEELEKELIEKSQKLGAKVILDDTIDSTITHIVSFAGRRTTKTLIGAVCGAWIVSQEWIQESIIADRFISESSFGSHYPAFPFFGKLFLLSDDFLHETKQVLIDHCKDLITMGKGFVITTENETSRSPDFTLVASSKTQKSSNNIGINFTLKQFLDFIQPCAVKL